MFILRARLVAASAVALAACAGLAQGQARFIPLGSLDFTGLESYAWGISADGSTIVGESSSASAGTQTEAFRYRGNGPMVGLGSINPSNVASVANAVSADGNVIVGFSRYASSGVLFSAFRTTHNEIIPSENLGDLAGGSTISNATGVSADGRFVVGYGTTVDPITQASRREAFRYDANGAGFRALGFLPTHRTSTAYGISADGLIVAGQSGNSSVTSATVWTFNPAGALVSTVALPAAPGGDGFCEAWGISSDGRVVVGDCSTINGSEATKWIDGQAVALGDLDGGAFASSALAASADGSVIVGYGTSATSGFFGEAVYWDSRGIHSLKAELEAAGIDLSGWELQVANSVSADGRRIVGNGGNPDGSPEAFLVILPPACPADFNGDGTLDPDDLADFIGGFFMAPSDPRTDFNRDGAIDPDDLADYIAAFFAGC